MPKLKGLFSKQLKDSQEDLVDTNDQEQDDNFLTEAETESEQKITVAGENETNQEWLDDSLEGQLSVDVYQDKNNVVIKSTIAGVKPEDIDISINNDLVTIKGKRENEIKVKQEDFFYQECYWGNFSRSIILPVEVKAESTNAELKNGILTIVMPKSKPNKAISVKVNMD